MVLQQWVQFSHTRSIFISSPHGASSHLFYFAWHAITCRISKILPKQMFPQIPLQTNACTCMHVNYMNASMHWTLCFTSFLTWKKVFSKYFSKNITITKLWKGNTCIYFVSLIINYYVLIFCCVVFCTNFVSFGPVTILVPIFSLSVCASVLVRAKYWAALLSCGWEFTSSACSTSF